LQIDAAASRKALDSAIDHHIEAKEALVDKINTGATTALGIGSVIATGGASLPLILGVAAASGMINVGAKQVILGQNADASLLGVGKDLAVGSVQGALNVVGPGEFAAILGVGKVVAAKAGEGVGASLVENAVFKDALKASPEVTQAQITEDIEGHLHQAISSGANGIEPTAIKAIAEKAVAKDAVNREQAVAALTDTIQRQLAEHWQSEATSFAQKSLALAKGQALNAGVGAIAGATGAVTQDLVDGQSVKEMASDALVQASMGGVMAFGMGSTMHIAGLGLKGIAYGFGRLSTATHDVPPFYPTPNTISEFKVKSGGTQFGPTALYRAANDNFVHPANDNFPMRNPAEQRVAVGDYSFLRPDNGAGQTEPNRFREVASGTGGRDSGLEIDAINPNQHTSMSGAKGDSRATTPTETGHASPVSATANQQQHGAEAIDRTATAAPPPEIKAPVAPEWAAAQARLADLLKVGLYQFPEIKNLVSTLPKEALDTEEIAKAARTGLASLLSWDGIEEAKELLDLNLLKPADLQTEKIREAARKALTFLLSWDRIGWAKQLLDLNLLKPADLQTEKIREAARKGLTSLLSGDDIGRAKELLDLNLLKPEEIAEAARRRLTSLLSGGYIGRAKGLLDLKLLEPADLQTEEIRAAARTRLTSLLSKGYIRSAKELLDLNLLKPEEIAEAAGTALTSLLSGNYIGRAKELLDLNLLKPADLQTEEIREAARKGLTSLLSGGWIDIAKGLLVLNLLKPEEIAEAARLGLTRLLSGGKFDRAKELLDLNLLEPADLRTEEIREAARTALTFWLSERYVSRAKELLVLNLLKPEEIAEAARLGLSPLLSGG
jgi:hypothetical protein